MDFITTPVYFGIALVIITFSFNFLHCILASIFGVRIEKFGVLLTFFNKNIMTFKRNHIDYSLGWFPTGGFVKISGMIDESLDPEEEMIIEDYMLLSKPPLVRFMCTIGAPLMLLILFVVGAVFVNTNTSLAENTQILSDVLANLYQYIAGEIDTTQMQYNWTNIANGNSVFAIVFCILILFTVFASLFSIISGKIAERIPTLSMIFFLFITLVYLYLLYQLGSLFFSINGFSGAITLFLKFLATTYILSFLVMLIIKFLPKNKYI